MTTAKKIVLDAKAIEQALTRMAHEILERNGKSEKLAIVGIRTAGVFVGDRIAAKIKLISGIEAKRGILDITLYRDDVREANERPQVKETKIDFALDGMKVILVDDVIYTGRSIRCALDELIDFGRPEVIQLAVLVDRGHRELPIRADYVGKNVPTAQDEKVKVHMTELGGVDEVVLEKGK